MLASPTMQLRQVRAEEEMILLFERGEELVRVLLDTCLDKGITNVLVQGSGRVSTMTLEGGPAGKRTVAGPLELLHLTGRVEQRGRRLEPELRVVACREMDTGLEMVGGVLQSALLEGAVARLTQHSPLSQIKVPASPASSWSAVAAASAELGEPEFEESDETPEAGDIVDHPKFGQCVVVKIDDSHLKIRRKEGRVVSLGLSILQFSLKGQKSDGKKVFVIRVKPKK